MRRALVLTATTLWLFGCGEKEDSVGDTSAVGPGETGDPGDTTDTQTDLGDDSERPSVVSGTIECLNTGGTSKVDTWFATATATDPQGTEDLAAFGSRLAAYSINDVEVYNDVALVCGSDGACSGSVTAEISSIACSAADDFYWAVQVVDDSGNASDWTVLDPV